MRFGGMGRSHGRLGSLAKKWAVTASSYSGPGDIVGSASAWWGFRAYSAATAGGNAVRIIRASDSTQQNFTTLANGNLDLASIATFLNATTGKVVTLFDQTGNGNDITQGTDAARPAYTDNVIGSLPGLTFSGAQNLTKSSVSFTTPYTWSAIAKRTASFTTFQCIMAGQNNSALFFANSTNTLDWFSNSGQDLTLAATDNVFHAIQATNDNSNSNLYSDGTTSTRAASGGAISILGMADRPSSLPLTGVMTEAGLWNVAFNSTQAGNMNSNQHTYWGF